MASSRVFLLVHGIEQRAGQAGTLATVRAGFGELGGVASECVGFFQRDCAGAQGRAAHGAVILQLVYPAAGASLSLGVAGGSSRCGTPARSWEGTPAQVTPLKCSAHNKTGVSHGFLHQALTPELSLLWLNSLLQSDSA